MAKRDFDTQWEWAKEKEPTYAGHHSPAKLDGAGTLQVVLGVIPSSYATDIIERSSILRCSVCERPCNAHKCGCCIANDARSCKCGGWTISGESACGECGEARRAA